MLILSRKIGQVLKIGDNVDVTIMGIRGNQVVIGINAPKEISVHREEIFDRIRKEQNSGDGSLTIKGSVG